MALLLFYLLASILFAFGIGTKTEYSNNIAPFIIWVIILLSQIIAISRIFYEDHMDGMLEQLLLLGKDPALIVLARIISTWLTSGLVMVLLVPVIGLLFAIDQQVMQLLIISLLCGTPLLSIITVTIAALIMSANAQTGIFAVLAFPLYIPVLIFGSSWISEYNEAAVFSDNMLLLLALTLLLTPFMVLAARFAIRINS